MFVGCLTIVSVETARIVVTKVCTLKNIAAKYVKVISKEEACSDSQTKKHTDESIRVSDMMDELGLNRSINV